MANLTLLCQLQLFPYHPALQPCQRTMLHALTQPSTVPCDPDVALFSNAFKCGNPCTMQKITGAKVTPSKNGWYYDCPTVRHSTAVTLTDSQSPSAWPQVRTLPLSALLPVPTRASLVCCRCEPTQVGWAQAGRLAAQVAGRSSSGGHRLASPSAKRCGRACTFCLLASRRNARARAPATPPAGVECRPARQLRHSVCRLSVSASCDLTTTHRVPPPGHHHRKPPPQHCTFRPHQSCSRPWTTPPPQTHPHCRTARQTRVYDCHPARHCLVLQAVQALPPAVGEG